ncbi:hypothetical protein J8F10_09270 [Gemmata sp. G18]|uniref:Uncharacterized protein n=1 Tax=Gemmata palustris TaxID=2822762 RepID=A0ABS5BP79_9BACT|nr:hypothetical protein [Gemmata palustris]MBP3955470.1 hypothetical protein [Gemmata palustris]
MTMKMKETYQVIAEAMPSKAEVGQELGNRVEEAKGFLGNVMSEIGSELGRLGVQGQAEVAQALFNGNAYVPYGEGQKGVEQETPQHGLPPVAQVEKQQEVEMEMER